MSGGLVGRRLGVVGVASSGPSTIREAAIQRAVPLPATTAMERYGRSCAVSGVDACMAVVREWLLAPDSIERAARAMRDEGWPERPGGFWASAAEVALRAALGEADT